jgi:hypothetical protein
MAKFVSIEVERKLIIEFIEGAFKTEFGSFLRGICGDDSTTVKQQLERKDLRSKDIVNKISFYECGLMLACMEGNISMVDLLLCYRFIDPSTHNNTALMFAVETPKGNGLLVLQRLLEDRRVNPSDNNNELIRFASHLGKLPIVYRLLQDPRVNPCDTRGGPSALQNSELGGFTEIVQLIKQWKKWNRPWFICWCS